MIKFKINLLLVNEIEESSSFLNTSSNPLIMPRVTNKTREKRKEAINNLKKEYYFENPSLANSFE